jgi:Domain of unknown function (DUF4159)
MRWRRAGNGQEKQKIDPRASNRHAAGTAPGENWTGSLMRRVRKAALPLIFAGAVMSAVFAQRAFRQYPSVEYGESIPLPPDWNQPAEWTFARLMYPPGPLDGYRGRFDGPWQEGLSLWTQDYPRADRSFANEVRRITRIEARSVEQSVSLDDGDEIYNWPWLYAVQVGEWGLTEAEAKKLRDYLLRGGFFMADDCHGTQEQAYFEKTMKVVFPDRELVDIPNDDPIFHTFFDLDDRFQIPGMEHLVTGHKKDGYVAHWKGIYDDKGRIMVAFSLNSDIGDSWEFLDDPAYPARFSVLGTKIGVNYVIYAMTH